LSRDNSANPWLYASIVITVLLIGILVWHLVYSYNLLTSFKDREFVIERSSWQLRLYAETMQLSALVSASSGDLKWKKDYRETRAELSPVLRRIRKLTQSPEVDRLTGQIEQRLDVITSVEEKAFSLVARGKKEEAFNLLSGWKYTKSQIEFSNRIQELVALIRERLERKTSFEPTRASILVVFGGFAVLILLWTITLRTWRVQTRRKLAADQALRQSENYYRAIFKTSGSAMFIIEEDTTIVLANSNFEELAGYPRQEIENKKSWIEFTHSDDVEWMKENHNLRRRNPDAAPRQYEFRFITRSGEERYLFLAVDVIPGTNQSIASGIDITERKQMEQALRESQNKYIQENNYFENLLEYSADAIGILNEKGRIVRWNRQAVEFTGYSYEEVYGRHFSEFYANKEEMEQLLAALQTNGSVRGWEVKLFNKEGDAVFCSVSVSVLSDERGEVLGSISIMRDLTEWKKTQQKLEELSIRDSLTGLYNRNFFEEEMKRLSDGRYNPLGIIICDLDGLKMINDTLGHQSGDRMIINTAEMLRRNFRPSDIIARIGGDEFAILLTETEKGLVEHMLQRLRQAMLDYNNTEPEIPLTMSLGYAVSEEVAPDMQALFREADDRMYREKARQKESGQHHGASPG